MLETLLNRLRDFHRDNEEGHGREQIIKDQAQLACTFARENELLEEPVFNFEDLVTEGVVKGSEHVVEFEEATDRVAKITVPKGFGLRPSIVTHAQAHANFRSEIAPIRQNIEFIPATPLEYLERWDACNSIFQDDVRLKSVILWPNGRVSLSISQPQYAGQIPDCDWIENYFSAAGWTRVSNGIGHVIFYNYAHDILAVDIEPRNCYKSDLDEILPFDVILSAPDEELKDYLNLFPAL
jgi:hypothetical protein